MTIAPGYHYSDAPAITPWMQVGPNGEAFFPEAPERCVIALDQIIPSLSRLCRFNGHARAFYSVAQHSVLVSQLVAPEFALDGLCHDAAEAFTGDMTSPWKWFLKRTVGTEGAAKLGAALHQIEKAVADALGVAWPMPPEVKQGDLRALWIERRDLLPPSAYAWDVLPAVPEWPRLEPLLPDQAAVLWWDRYHELLDA
jgi:hypothetical protein